MTFNSRILVMGRSGIGWMSLNLIGDKSTLVKAMAGCRQAASHDPRQCWSRSTTSLGIARRQWINHQTHPYLNKWPMFPRTTLAHTFCWEDIYNFESYSIEKFAHKGFMYTKLIKVYLMALYQKADKPSTKMIMNQFSGVGLNMSIPLWRTNHRTHGSLQVLCWYHVHV